MLEMSIPDAVGWLGWCFGVYFGIRLAWTLFKSSKPRHVARWMIFAGLLGFLLTEVGEMRSLISK